MTESISQHYHQRTKYDPQTIANKSHKLDWNQQPTTTKEYKLGTRYDLKPYLADSNSLKKTPTEQNWRRLSRLLVYSYGLTAKVHIQGSSPLYLRTAPSAGGLYPAEVYLLSRGTPLLPAGLYNYQVQSHSLIGFWQEEVWSHLQQACFGHPALEETDLAIATTAIFYRSAWRYEDRAYRRIFLDTGHLLGNVELGAAITGYRPCLIGGFCDRTLNDLLYLDTSQEGVTTVVSLADLDASQGKISLNYTALPSPIQKDYPQIPDGELLQFFHQATQIEPGEAPVKPHQEKVAQEDKYNFPFCSKVSMSTTPIDWGNNLEELTKTIFKRRSTRRYTGEDLTLDELKALLNFTYQPQDYVDLGLDATPDYFALDLLSTFVAISGVTGLETGCYYYAPQEQELRQIRFKNFRQELHYLCLGQDLGRDAAAVVFHTANLQQAIALYGDRVYRYLHLDAGHLGQRLNLAAIRLGLGISGIGGFFDDQVNEVLGIPEDEAVIYITTLGCPR